MDKAAQPGDGAAKGQLGDDAPKEATLDPDGSTARSLYELLDILVAMRIDVDPRHDAAASAFKPAKIRAMLDSAIASAKAIIGEIAPPRS